MSTAIEKRRHDLVDRDGHDHVVTIIGGDAAFEESALKAFRKLLSMGKQDIINAARELVDEGEYLEEENALHCVVGIVFNDIVEDFFGRNSMKGYHYNDYSQISIGQFSSPSARMTNPDASLIYELGEMFDRGEVALG